MESNVDNEILSTIKDGYVIINGHKVNKQSLYNENGIFELKYLNPIELQYSKFFDIECEYIQVWYNEDKTMAEIKIYPKQDGLPIYYSLENDRKNAKFIENWLTSNLGKPTYYWKKKNYKKDADFIAEGIEIKYVFNDRIEISFSSEENDITFERFNDFIVKF